MCNLKTKFLAALILLFLTSCNTWRGPSTEEIEKLKVRIESANPPKWISNQQHGRKLWNWTKEVYASRQFRPAWSTRGRINADADRVIRTLENAPAEGLHAEDFGVTDLSAMRQALGRSPDPMSQIELDVDLMYSLVQYVSQLCFGRVEPREVDPTWQPAQRECDVPRIVYDAVEQGNFESFAEHLAPRIKEYKALKAALEQARNVSVQEQIEKIEINLDRIRWMPDDPGPRHILVNVPAFELTVHDGDQVPLRMRAIVGSIENRTPIFSREMQYVVFSPYWNIPLSIATKEFLPKIRQDTSYLSRQNIEVIRTSGRKAETIDPSEIDWDEVSDNFRYQLRQKPGASNSLGLVKFVFPNPYNVYLHDTPADNLFARLTRTLSHGCIRIERPRELAAYVLRDQPEWTPERIEAAMHSENEKHVTLKRRLPVHIVYWTASVDANGAIRFSDDVYGYDEKQRALTPR